MTGKAEMGGVLLERQLWCGQSPAAKGISSREVCCWPTELLEEKAPFAITKENCLKQESLWTAGFLQHCERPSIFIAINSVKVGFTKENGGNHLVIL